MKKIKDIVNDFNSSISFDQRMYREEIKISVAHSRMLEKCGIISNSDREKITHELELIQNDIESGKLRFDEDAEDIHMFIEKELTMRLANKFASDAGKRLHTARSRNDQVATALRKYLEGETNKIIWGIGSLKGALHSLACLHNETIMPGYTHMQRAQPVTFADHLFAYVQMFIRDISRLKDAVGRMMSECPLGSGALAGTSLLIDRNMTAQSLGFKDPCVSTIDGVSDRDFCMEIAGALSIVMVHLSRLAEELILWCSWEFKFIELDDSFVTGSSLMPQKRNPDIAELVRGKAGRVFGDLQTLLVVMKGLPLAYNKDMQEDKQAIFDAVDTVKNCLDVFTPMFKTLKVNVENMRNAAAKGFINATECADYLVRKGMAFRDAYKLTGKIVSFCNEKNFDLESLPIAEYKKHSDLFDESIYDAVNLEYIISRRKKFYEQD